MEEAVEVLPQLEELYKDDLPDIVLFDFLALAGKLFMLVRYKTGMAPVLATEASNSSVVANVTLYPRLTSSSANVRAGVFRSGDKRK
jgi:hypothetical protein